jgi:hypothetical protein
LFPSTGVGHSWALRGSTCRHCRRRHADRLRASSRPRKERTVDVVPQLKKAAPVQRTASSHRRLDAQFESHRDFRDGPEYSVSSGEGSQDEVPFTASQRHGSHFNEQVELAQPRSTATMLTVREYR